MKLFGNLMLAAVAAFATFGSSGFNSNSTVEAQYYPHYQCVHYRTCSSTSAEQTSSGREENASYQGTVEETGGDIYMEGTHSLRLPNDEFILLESDSVDLDAFVGKKTEVYGTVRDTVESGGRIMNVSEVTMLSDNN